MGLDTEIKLIHQDNGLCDCFILSSSFFSSKKNSYPHEELWSEWSATK